MRSRWTPTPDGLVLNPPEQCPACGWAWPWRSGAQDRPRSAFLRCYCGSGPHSAWLCGCGALVAEECSDVHAWDPLTIPALPGMERWSLAAEHCPRG